MFDGLYNGTQNMYGFAFLPCLLQPASVGDIKLRSQNPFEYPMINPNYLEDERDVQIMLDGKNTLVVTISNTVLKAMTKDLGGNQVHQRPQQILLDL